MWRVAAEARRAKRPAMHATTRTAVPLAAASTNTGSQVEPKADSSAVQDAENMVTPPSSWPRESGGLGA